VRAEDMITMPTNYSYDRLLYIQTMASGVIPRISLIMGPCLGAAAISAQLSDFVFMVRDISYSYVSTPPEGISSDEMGGATMHFKNSGCCDVYAARDEDCINKA